MFNYKIFNVLKKIKISKKTIDLILIQISKNIKKSQNWTLNIIFVSNKKIQDLNKKYRKIDKPTDVLSFHYFDDFAKLKKTDIAWEIIISSTKIISQAKEYWITIEEEFYKLLIHSILHILWFDHKNKNDFKIMEKYEILILNKIKIC